MLRLVAVASVIGIFSATGVSPQQPASVVAGKWEVSITGRAVRLLELTPDGTSVTGTLHGGGSVPVTGELRDKNLVFQTKAGDEFFTLVLKDAEFHGTYVYHGGSREESFKTGVTLKRPAR